MKPVVLRKKLLQLLSKELGVYTNGKPSIWVYGSGSNPPSSSNGLEVLIKNIPLNAAQAVSGGIKYKPQEWEVHLKNFKQDKSLLTALSKIEKNFVVSRYTHIPADEKFIEQATLYIFDPIGV